MTPISHAFCGFSTGYLVAPLGEKLGVQRKTTVALSTLAALIPDIDAIWLFINKTNYTSKAWYGHHGATHSFVGAVLLGSLLGLTVIAWLHLQSWFLRAGGTADKPLPKQSLWLISTGIPGAMVHLPGDLITLSGVWGGLPLFWPLDDSRIPALGIVPWRDYCIISIAIISFFIFPVLALMERGPIRRHFLSWPAAFLSLLLIIVYLFKTPVYTNSTEWHQSQRKLIGEKLYKTFQTVESRYVWPLFR